MPFSPNSLEVSWNYILERGKDYSQSQPKGKLLSWKEGGKNQMLNGEHIMNGITLGSGSLKYVYFLPYI